MGGDEHSNLIILCKTCHSRAHNGEISEEGVRMGKGFHELDKKDQDEIINLMRLKKVAKEQRNSGGRDRRLGERHVAVQDKLRSES
jgi:hypothetical protein